MIKLYSLILILCGLVTPAWSQSTFDVSILASSCVNCHDSLTNSGSAIPSLTHQSETLLLQKLQAFQSETPPPNTTIMDRLIGDLNAEQLAALARYFASKDIIPLEGASQP